MLWCRFAGVEPDRETWKAAHRLFVQAFRDPPDPRERRMLLKILSTPVPEDVCRELFVDYDAFLLGLGRMSLSARCSALASTICDAN